MYSSDIFFQSKYFVLQLTLIIFATLPSLFVEMFTRQISLFPYFCLSFSVSIFSLRLCFCCSPTHLQWSITSLSHMCCSKGCPKISNCPFQPGWMLINTVSILPWRRRGILVIESASRPEDRGFESRRGVRFLGTYSLQCCFLKLKIHWYCFWWNKCPKN
jgi:hypothetical protein